MVFIDSKVVLVVVVVSGAAVELLQLELELESGVVVCDSGRRVNLEFLLEVELEGEECSLVELIDKDSLDGEVEDI